MKGAAKRIGSNQIYEITKFAYGEMVCVKV